MFFLGGGKRLCVSSGKEHQRNSHEGASHGEEDEVALGPRLAAHLESLLSDGPLNIKAAVFCVISESGRKQFKISRKRFLPPLSLPPHSHAGSPPPSALFFLASKYQRHFLLHQVEYPYLISTFRHFCSDRLLKHQNHRPPPWYTGCELLLLRQKKLFFHPLPPSSSAS